MSIELELILFSAAIVCLLYYYLRHWKIRQDIKNSGAVIECPILQKGVQASFTTIYSKPVNWVILGLGEDKTIESERVFVNYQYVIPEVSEIIKVYYSEKYPKKALVLTNDLVRKDYYRDRHMLYAIIFGGIIGLACAAGTLWLLTNNHFSDLN